MRFQFLVVLLSASLTVSSCAAGIAASAVGMAVRSARGEAEANQQLQPQAAQACFAHAAQHGEVHVIDVQQSSASKIVVWGTVSVGSERQSFECSYGTRITEFRLRAIRSR